MKLSKGTDHSHRVVLPSQIVRAFWSRRRAWHGDEVQLHIETRYVPDGASVDVEIWEDDPGPDEFIVPLPAAGQVKDGRCVIDHKIDWSPKARGKDLELEGDDYEFYFVAIIRDLDLSKQSTLLYVDLDEFRISG